jgi:hypothetical protein
LRVAAVDRGVPVPVSGKSAQGDADGGSLHQPPLSRSCGNYDDGTFSKPVVVATSQWVTAGCGDLVGQRLSATFGEPSGSTALVNAS